MPYLGDSQGRIDHETRAHDRNVKRVRAPSSGVRHQSSDFYQAATVRTGRVPDTGGVRVANRTRIGRSLYPAFARLSLPIASSNAKKAKNVIPG